jgi:hypothetical protein
MNMKKTTNYTIVILLILSTLLSSCTKDSVQIKGEGEVVTEDISMPPITGVSLSIEAEIVLTEGDTQMIRIEAQQNIINNIERFVSNGIWRIGYYDNVGSHAPVRIYITIPELDYATVSGSGIIRNIGSFADTNNIYLSISGSGKITLGVIALNIESDISGSGQITLTGSANEHRIRISGSGGIRAFGLETKLTDISISGSGNCEVFATDFLEVYISGSGNVYYLGSPQITTNISGSGGVFNSN